MTKIASTLQKLRRGELTFGLREAIVIASIGIAVAVIAAYQHVHK